MRYSENFLRDWEWFAKWHHVFLFDGTADYVSKSGKQLIVFDKDGLSAIECFYAWDSEGKILPCNEPEYYRNILRCKGAINLQIKAWAKGRADCSLPGIEFSKSVKEKELAFLSEEEKNKPLWNFKTVEEDYELLPWMVCAVESQKWKYI